MSRPSGPGVPPNGWPTDNLPPDNHNPYNDPYYAQRQPQQPAQPPAPQQAGRPPRIQPQAQAPAPSRTPQPGLPPGSLPQPGYAQQPPQYQQPPAPQAPGPQYAPPQAPQYAPPYAPPQQAYAPERTQQPTRPPQQQLDPRYGAYPGPDYGAQPVAPQRPQSPPQAPQAYPAQFAPPPSPQQQYAANQQVYVPEQPTRVVTQPPQQRAAPSFDPWPGQAAPPSNAPAVDPRGYDLGNYMPSGTPSGTPASDPRTGDPRTGRPTASPGWPTATPEHAATAPRAPAYASEPTYPQVTAHPHDVNAGSLEPLHEDGEYEDEEEEYEEAPRKARYGLIAASLIGAIVAGGGLAYAYKVFVAPTMTAGATPVIKSAGGPPKVRPAEPGGTKFADPGPKVMEQLANAQTSVQTTGSNPDGGPVAVRTIDVGRDGTIRDAKPAPSVPGMILEGGGAIRPAARPPAATPPVPLAAAPIAPPAAASVPAAPVAAAVVAPPVVQKKVAAAVAPAAIDPDTGLPAVAPKKPVAKSAVPKTALGGPATGVNGFVAVIASMPATATSKIQAMQQFADLQQKYGTVLGGKSPDVVDAKIKDKGDYHRLIVGPPGSRESATSLCTQLKAAGYTADCWVTGY